MKSLIALLIPMLTMCAASSERTGKNAELELKTERVVVFKDGYALVVKSGRAVADPEGRVFTDDVPDRATLGSFWASAQGKSAIAMRAEWVDRKRTISARGPALSILDLLRANRGKMLRLVRPDNVAVEAKVLELLEDESQTATLVVLENEAGRTVWPIVDIRTINGARVDTQLERTTSTVTHVKRLTFEMGDAAKNEPVAIRLFYFTEGVRWVPTYRLDGDLEKNSELVLQGELLNEAEPIEDAVIDLVAGVPSFKMKSVPSPLSLEQVLRSALASAAPGLGGQIGNQLSNANFQYRAGDDVGLSPSARDLDLASASGESDLTVYHGRRMSLPKGGRLTMPLFATKLEVRHVFTLEASFPSSNAPIADPTGMEQNKIWHQLELTNLGVIPWTNGPVLMMKNMLPLGQDMLGFTPKGCKTRVPVTVAVNLRSTVKDTELSRRPNAMLWNKTSYAEIRMKSTIKITNASDQRVTQLVKVHVAGRAENPSTGGKIALLGSAGVNPRSEIEYEISLDPNETRELSAEYVSYAY